MGEGFFGKLPEKKKKRTLGWFCACSSRSLHLISSVFLFLSKDCYVGGWTDILRTAIHLSKFHASKPSLTCLLRLTTVQQVCIPTAILNVDVLCQAKSGLGKTAVFVLTTLHQLEPVPGECQVLVMCHTRELAYQIKNEYARFSKYLPDVKTAVFYGGTPMQRDIELLSNKDTYPNIVVGTPGRLNALVRDKKLSLRSVKCFVLDECDKMLDQIGMAFIPYNFILMLTSRPRYAA